MEIFAWVDANVPGIDLAKMAAAKESTENIWGPLDITDLVVRCLNTATGMTFTLDDSSAMAPGMKLSTAGAVIVVARVSRAGNATAQSGDLEGSVGPIRPGSKDIQLKIDKVLP